jgi:hypothetical protein
MVASLPSSLFADPVASYAQYHVPLSPSAVGPCSEPVAGESSLLLHEVNSVVIATPMVRRAMNILIIFLVFIFFLGLLLQSYTKIGEKETKKPPDSHPTVASLNFL